MKQDTITAKDLSIGFVTMFNGFAYEFVQAVDPDTTHIINPNNGSPITKARLDAPPNLLGTPNFRTIYEKMTWNTHENAIITHDHISCSEGFAAMFVLCAGQDAMAAERAFREANAKKTMSFSYRLYEKNKRERLALEMGQASAFDSKKPQPEQPAANSAAAKVIALFDRAPATLE